jgi:hypothetical protein
MMTTHVEGAFEVTSWSEHQAGGLVGTAKVATVTIGQRFTGGIEAQAISDLVMTYRDDGIAEFAGYQRVQGRIGDKAGSFVLRALGEFDGEEARTRLAVVPGSATGDLAGLPGSGLAVARRGSTGTVSLDYEL